MAICFDLASIPEDAEIESATLSLFIYDGFLDQKWFNNGPKEIYVVNGSWDDANLTWDNAPEISTTALDLNSNTTLWGWEYFDVTEDLKNIFSNNKENYGWMIGHTTTSYGAFYRSSEYSDIEQRPKLKITFNSQTDINKNILNPSLDYSQEATFRILNLQGKVLKEYKGNDFKNVLKSMSKGINIISISQNGKTTIYKRLVK